MERISKHPRGICPDPSDRQHFLLVFRWPRPRDGQETATKRAALSAFLSKRKIERDGDRTDIITDNFHSLLSHSRRFPTPSELAQTVAGLAINLERRVPRRPVCS